MLLLFLLFQVKWKPPLGAGCLCSHSATSVNCNEWRRRAAGYPQCWNPGQRKMESSKYTSGKEMGGVGGRRRLWYLDKSNISLGNNTYIAYMPKAVTFVSFPMIRFCLYPNCSSCSFSSVQFSRSVVSDSLRPHESQHARPPCPSPTPGVHSDSCPSSQWCHPAISSSVIPFSSCPQSLPASCSL